MPYKVNPFTGKLEYYEAPQSMVIILSEWITGEGIPSDLLGEDGKFYLDTLTLDLYQKENGTWV